MKKIPDYFWLALLLPVVAWFVVANLVFTFRHPWMTEVERFVWMKSALLFETVPYHEARP